MRRGRLHRFYPIFVIVGFVYLESPQEVTFTCVCRITLGFMLPTWFLSMWITNTATTAMVMPIAEAVLRELEAPVEKVTEPGESNSTRPNPTRHGPVNDAMRRDATRRDATRRDATRRDATRRDATRRDATRRDATRRDATRRDATRRDATRRDATRRDATRRDTTRHDTTRHDTTRHDTTRHDTTRHDTTRTDRWSIILSTRTNLVLISSTQSYLRDK